MASDCEDSATAIETARLRLEPIGERHFEDLAALRAGPEVMATMKDGPETRAETGATLARYRETWRAHGFGIWAVVERASGGFLGECGFWLRDDGLGVALRVALAASARGRGLAREAAAAALDYGFVVAGLERIVAVARQDNARSHALLEALGMTLLATRAGTTAPLVVYGLERALWRARSSTSPTAQASPTNTSPPAPQTRALPGIENSGTKA